MVTAVSCLHHWVTFYSYSLSFLCDSSWTDKKKKKKKGTAGMQSWILFTRNPVFDLALYHQDIRTTSTLDLQSYINETLIKSNTHGRKGIRSKALGQSCHGSFKLTRLLMRISSSFWASRTASSVPTTVISSWSWSSGVGKMILAPVLSRTFLMFAPPFPMRNLWYSGLARSSAVWLFICWVVHQK